MFYRAFDKNTLEYKGTYELIEDREPAEYFVVCETSKEIEIPKGKKCIFDLDKKTNGYKFISTKEFTELQISLGNREPLKDTEKLDEEGKDIENTQNARFPIQKLEDLLGLSKAIKDKWKETFYNRRMTLDSLEELSLEEIQKLFLETN